MSILLNTLLVFATLSTAMVAGLVFTFGVVIMPGIGKLDDRGFIRAFQVIDGVIQKGQPLFGLVWLGSVLSLMAACILGFWEIDGLLQWLLLTANLIYIGGVQVPTFTVNVPRNNRLQAILVETLDDTAATEERRYFEATWNRSNNFRTVVATVVTLMLLLILLLS